MITEAEWAAALGAAEQGADGFTARELALQLGVSRTFVLSRLHTAVANKTVIVGRGRRPRMDGVVGIVPVYRMKKKEK
jgi:hypothetical protein